MNRANRLLLKTLLPACIGIAVVVWLFVREFDPSEWKEIRWTAHTVGYIALAWVFMAGREAGLSWRFRALSDRALSWRQSIKVTMLCEFTSAITPGTAGGSALSMVFMQREGISAGRGTALTICTLLLDEAFFVVAAPIIFLLVSPDSLFAFDTGNVGDGIRIMFWIVYAGIILWTAVLFAGIFIRPQAVCSLIKRIGRLRILRRWEGKIDGVADNMLETSRDISRRGIRWWVAPAAATTLSWVSRYLVVNALFAAFATGVPQLLVFARQFVVWTLLTVSPTPGGSGVSEWLFTAYYGDMLHDPAVILLIAVFWRVITYYVYLATGAFMIPSWVREGLPHKKHPTK